MDKKRDGKRLAPLHVVAQVLQGGLLTDGERESTAWLSPAVNHSPVPDHPQGEPTPKPGGSETARGRLYSTKKVEMPVLAVKQNARVCIREVWLPKRNSYQTRRGTRKTASNPLALNQLSTAGKQVYRSRT